MSAKLPKNPEISGEVRHLTVTTGIVSIFALMPLIASASELGTEYALPSSDVVLFAVGVIVAAVIAFTALYFISQKVHGDGKPSNQHSISYLINNDMPLSVFDIDFMYQHYEVTKRYQSIKVKYQHIKSSAASTASKDKADILILVAGKALDALGTPSEVTLDRTHSDSEISLAKLCEIEHGLLKIINDDPKRLGYTATDLVMPDAHILQERLDNLRIIASNILYQADIDGADMTVERTDTIRKILDVTLSKLYDDYIAIAFRTGADDNTVFFDMALTDIFDDISEFFYRIDAGMDADDNLFIVSKLSNNDDWFNRRYEASIELGGFDAKQQRQEGQ